MRHVTYMKLIDAHGDPSGVNVEAGVTKSGRRCLRVIAVGFGDMSLKGKLIFEGDPRLMTNGMFESVYSRLLSLKGVTE
jgi:hypothetical protein